jgi:hypothetical protein
MSILDDSERLAITLDGLDLLFQWVNSLSKNWFIERDSSGKLRNLIDS